MNFTSVFAGTLFSQVHLGYALWQWLGIVVFFGVGIFLKYAVELLVPFAEHLVSKTTNKFDDLIIAAIRAPVGWMMLAGVWGLGLEALAFRGGLDAALDKMVLLVFCIGLVQLAYNFVDVFGAYLSHLAARSHNVVDDQVARLLQKSLRLAVVIFGVLMSLQSLGLNVMSVLAGLGIGGLALALAAKDTAANFFGSVMILLDRPFKAGDWIIVGEHEGIVENIGLRSTRLRTFYQSQVSIPNAITAGATVDNMGRRPFRRLLLRLRLDFSTPVNGVNEFVSRLRQIVLDHPAAVKERVHIHLNDIKESGYEVLVYCFVYASVWAEELEHREQLLRSFMLAAGASRVRFAPTQVLSLASSAATADCQAGVWAEEPRAH